MERVSHWYTRYIQTASILPPPPTHLFNLHFFDAVTHNVGAGRHADTLWSNGKWVERRVGGRAGGGCSVSDQAEGLLSSFICFSPALHFPFLPFCVKGVIVNERMPLCVCLYAWLQRSCSCKCQPGPFWDIYSPH